MAFWYGDVLVNEICLNLAQIPTGKLINVSNVPALDFRKGMKLNTYIHTNKTEGICGK
jgi:hypothetical protein